jgi:hypothetical protein
MAFTHGHALIIGVGSYRFAPHLNVPITAADAEAVATALRDPRLCGYPDANVTLLANEGATRDGVLAALHTLAQRTTSADTILLFYSGHGEYSADGAYALTTHDTRFDTGGKVVTGAAVSQTDLITALRAIPAQRVLVLINACHAGELSPTLGAGQPAVVGQPFPQQTTDALLATGSGRIIITACREQQVSYIGPGPLTIFAQALTDGLRGQGVSGRAGFISAFDLYTHLYFAVREAVEQRVPLALRQQYGLTQEPELTVLKGVGPFAVALFRGATQPGDFPTDHAPPPETAMRTVEPSRSRWAFQQITGERAVNVAGSVSNSTIITGDGNTVAQGDIIRTGDISGSGIAIGRGAQAHVQGAPPAARSVAALFAPVEAAIRQRPDDPIVTKDELLTTVRWIADEAAQGAQASEQRLIRLLHTLAAAAPDIFAPVVTILQQQTICAAAMQAAFQVQRDGN